jgi:hypothetical protein
MNPTADIGRSVYRLNKENNEGKSIDFSRVDIYTGSPFGTILPPGRNRILYGSESIVSFIPLAGKNEDEPVEVKRKANLSNVTTGFYAQKKKTYYFSAVSYLFGTEAYHALAFDGGIGSKIIGPVSAEIGTYLLRESSILWHPDEERRGISICSVKGGLNIQILKWLTLQGRGYYYMCSENVNASSFSIGVVFTPVDPLFIHFYYFKYSESADYHFSGDYFSIGINYYH